MRSGLLATACMRYLDTCAVLGVCAVFGMLWHAVRRTVRACPSNVNPNCVSTASTNDVGAGALLHCGVWWTLQQ